MGTKLIYTYPRNIGVLEDQAILLSELATWSNMDKLIAGPIGKLMLATRDVITTQLFIVFNVIQFQVFCRMYHNAYVGNAGADKILSPLY